MRFVLSVAFKYLIPRWRHLSVSIISLVSILVISLVVWLVLIFLSVTEGIEKNWVKQLVTLNAPVRISPTDDYYKSYYYLIDTVSSASDYSTKTLGEKLKASTSDPYDPLVDSEISPEFPSPDRASDGSVKDLVKEAWNSIASLEEKKTISSLRPSEYEVSFGNLRLQLLRDDALAGEKTQTYLSQVSYVASLDSHNEQFQKLLLSPTSEDLNNLLASLFSSPAETIDDGEPLFSSPAALDDEKIQKSLAAFFDNTQIVALKTADEGYRLPRALFPESGSLKGCGIIRNGRITKVIIPQSEERLATLQKTYASFGHTSILGEIQFGEGRPTFSPLEASTIEVPKRLELLLEPGITFNAKLLSDSLANAHSLSGLQFNINTSIQGFPLTGTVRYEQLQIATAVPKTLSPSGSPFWVHRSSHGDSIIPHDETLGEGILVAKSYRDSGVRLGDRGYLTYFTQSTSGMQEQRLQVYVAGFYDPGFMAAGNKLLLVDPRVTAILRGTVSVADKMLGNGFQIWFSPIEEAPAIKALLEKSFKEQGIDRYWTVESFEDYEFARPVLEQLKSDKTLFTLIAVIILVVACSNIISMLILLVNDKKREVGILQSLGASSKHIAAIFGICGFLTGLVSSVVGTAVAMITLKNLQSLVNFLSFLQGHEAFHSAFYGESLPNELSMGALAFVLIATGLISLLAGIAPAIKAAKIRPSEILRSE